VRLTHFTSLSELFGKEVVFLEENALSKNTAQVVKEAEAGFFLGLCL